MPLPVKMRAVEISQPGGPEVLKLAERPGPQPKAHEILVKVAAAGVNRPDVLQRSGNYPVPPDASDLPGLEIAGEVVAKGSAVTLWKIGDQLCALAHGGGYAEYCTVPEVQALPVPKGLSLIEAASLPETCFTEEGRLVFIASLRGPKTELSIDAVMRKRLTITGSTLRPRSVEFKGYIARNLREKIWPRIEAGRIRPVIYKTFPLAQAAEAHRLMESSQHIGKLVLTV